MDHLVEYDMQLVQEGFANANFLKAVVMWLLDADRKNAAPMPEDVKKRMMELRQALKSI